MNRNLREEGVQDTLSGEQRLVGGELLLVGTRSSDGPEVGHADVLVLAVLRVLQNEHSLRDRVLALGSDPLDTTRLQRRHLDLVQNQLVLLHRGENATTGQEIANLQEKQQNVNPSRQKLRSRKQAVP